jgi:hypothetical protein
MGSGDSWMEEFEKKQQKERKIIIKEFIEWMGNHTEYSICLRNGRDLMDHDKYDAGYEDEALEAYLETR